MNSRRVTIDGVQPYIVSESAVRDLINFLNNHPNIFTLDQQLKQFNVEGNIVRDEQNLILEQRPFPGTL